MERLIKALSIIEHTDHIGKITNSHIKGQFFIETVTEKYHLPIWKALCRILPDADIEGYITDGAYTHQPKQESPESLTLCIEFKNR